MKKLIILLIVVAFLTDSCSEKLCPAYTSHGTWNHWPPKEIKK
jgi:hypothetical protein